MNGQPPSPPQAQPQAAAQPPAPHPGIPGRKPGKIKWVLIAAGGAVVVTALIVIVVFAVQTKSVQTKSWTNTGGGVSSYYIESLAYDSVHKLLYAGTWGRGVWKYDGTTWTTTGCLLYTSPS